RGGEADGHDWRDNDHVVPLADRAGRGGRLGRRGGGDSGPAERDRSGAGRANQGRGPGGRQDREPAGARRGNAGDRGFDGPGFDGPGFDTGGFDSGGRGGEPPKQPRPAAASARSGRGKGSNAGGPDWDSMSDIDYWTELASDKPLTTTAQPAGPTGRP